jgi:acetyl esterase/lipase
MDWPTISERMKEFKRAVPNIVEIFDDTPRYDENAVRRLEKLESEYAGTQDAEARARMRGEAASIAAAIALRPDAPERIYLWPEGRMPVKTPYTDNSDDRYNHGPEFRPYFLEMLLPADVTPRGAVICIPGGDHGAASVKEGYQVARDLNEMGYQCFVLHNRVNHNPWSEEESGVDAARCVRMVRKNAAKYRIDPDNVAIAGFSNGGLTGDNCIRYYSGLKRVQDVFPDYVSDEYDEVYGAPDAFLCVYGPRFAGSRYDFSGVVYPPTFFAVGREDNAMENLNYVYPIMTNQGIPVEVHTFAGVPHGVAGLRFREGAHPYPTFDLWYTLADAFMQNVYSRKKK